METTQNLRSYAEECVARAKQSVSGSDRALWLILAQSWAHLAEHVGRFGGGGRSDGAGLIAGTTDQD